MCKQDGAWHTRTKHPSLLRLGSLYMYVSKRGSRVLWYECAGFGLIIFLSWLNELVDLARYLMGGTGHSVDARKGVVLTLVVLLVWLVVFRLTRRLVEHLHYLEGFLRVCAWCRKIGHGDRWVQIEEYFAEGFQIETTHGMCPECLKKVEEDTARFVSERDKDPGAAPKAQAA
jgi:hypothetical protein